MKLLALRVAEVCCDISNNGLQYDDAHVWALFQSVRCCCTPAIDRLAAAEVLAVHGVTANKHTFYFLLLHWVASPDLNRDDAQRPADAPADISPGCTDHTAVAPPPASQPGDKTAAGQTTPGDDAPHHPTEANLLAACK